MNPGIEIRPVENRKDQRSFMMFPYRHYKNEPNWVPPLLMDQKVLLNPARYPFYPHADFRFFMAFIKGRPAGRIGAFVDHRHNEIHQEKTGFFGFFETIDDYEVAEGLLSSARIWIKGKGMNRFRGPVNPSQNEDCGMLIDAFDQPPVIMMPYNYPYYPGLVEKFGLKKVMDLWAYHIDGRNDPPPEKLVRIGESIRKREKLTVRPIRMKDFKNEAEKVWYIYNHAWIDNWGFVPMTKAEFEYLAHHLKQVVVPEIALMAEIQDKPVGFSLTIPDINRALIKLNGRLLPFGLLKLMYYQRKIDTVRIVILGVISDYRNRGIDALLYLDTWRNCIANGYYSGEMSWILENNTMMNRSAVMLGGKVYKTYRMYEQEI